MKQLTKFGLIPLLFLALLSCSVEPAEIEYGKDQCDFCVMNIVDKTHAAQFVTKKGKQFKFDAIECMMRDMKTRNPEDLEIILVADYSNPGKMIPVESAGYLISKEIKSPMGANLSALPSVEKATELQSIHQGKVYTWETLVQRFNKK